MKVWLSFGILVSAALMWSGCAKTESDGPEAIDENVAFSPMAEETKAMISSSSFLTVGNSIEVKDYLSYNSAEMLYIDDKITYNSEGKWPQAKTPYAWTKTGTHRFFGWLVNDATSSPALTPSSLWDSGITFSNKVLSVPSVAMDFDSSAQFDMLYSNVVIRTMTNASTDDHSAVALNMKHLFSAVSFGIKNELKHSVTIKEFKLQGIKNTASATIDFSGNATAVNYSTVTGAVGKTWTGTCELAAKTDAPNAFEPTATVRNPRLMWPLSWSDLNPGTEGTDYGFDADGNMITNTSSPLIYVTYVINGVEHTSVVALTKDLGWAAGSSVHYDVIFADKQIIVTATVSDWDYQENLIDYESNTISVSSGKALSMDATYGNYSKVKTTSGTSEVTFTTGLPVCSHFTLATPVGGSWIVELAGTDAEAFNLYSQYTSSEETPVATVSGAVGDEATFYIKPKDSLPLGQYKCKVKVTVVFPNGRYANADDVVQVGESDITYILVKK